MIILSNQIMTENIWINPRWCEEIFFVVLFPWAQVHNFAHFLTWSSAITHPHSMHHFNDMFIGYASPFLQVRMVFRAVKKLRSTYFLNFRRPKTDIEYFWKLTFRNINLNLTNMLFWLYFHFNAKIYIFFIFFSIFLIFCSFEKWLKLFIFFSLFL